jgi:hypothetical protein
MRQQSKYFQRSLSALIVTCALASGSVYAASKPFVALISTVEGIGPSDPPSPSCPVAGTSAGNGKSNLFSKGASAFTNVVLTAKDCVTLDANLSPTRFDQGQFTIVGEPVLGQASDSITATYQGTLTLNRDGTYALTGTFSVTGGTGKYVGAYGTGELTGTEIINVAAGTAQGQLKAVGKINY